MENIVRKKVKNNPCNPKKSYKVFKRVGGGSYGDVYKACNNTKCEKPIAVKLSEETLKHEYEIFKRIQNIGTSPIVFGYEKCTDKNILYSQFIPDGDLKNFISKSNPSSIEIKKILAILLINLIKIAKTEPTFRHNDLHTGNILIARSNVPIKIKYGNFEFTTNIIPLITDLGLSTINKVKNTLLTDFLKDNYGVYPNSHPLYDVHFLFNTLKNSLKKTNYANFFTLINDIFEKRYLVEDSVMVKNFRLSSYMEKYHKLPTIEEILSNQYFNNLKIKTTNYVMPKKSLSITTKKVPIKTKNYVMPNNMNEAKKKALSILTKKVPLKTKKIVMPNKALNVPIKKAPLKTKASPKKMTPTMSLRKRMYYVLNGKKCDRYKKPVLKRRAIQEGIDVSKKTKAMLCEQLFHKTNGTTLKQYLQVSKRKCDGYKKADIQKAALKYGVKIEKKTKAVLCDEIMKKI